MKKIKKHKKFEEITNFRKQPNDVFKNNLKKN